MLRDTPRVCERWFRVVFRGLGLKTVFVAPKFDQDIDEETASDGRNRDQESHNRSPGAHQLYCASRRTSHRTQYPIGIRKA